MDHKEGKKTKPNQNNKLKIIEIIKFLVGTESISLLVINYGGNS